MKILRTLVIIWGFIVILVLPVLLWFSHLGKGSLDFRDYVICVLLFFLGIYVVRDDQRKGKTAGSDQD